MLLRLARYDEAMEEIRIAQELDPLSSVIRDVLAMIYYLTGQEDLAMDICKKSIEFDTNFPNAHHTLAKIYLHKSMFEEAINEFQKAIDASNRNIIWYLGDLGYTFGILGKEDDALRILEELQARSKLQYVPKYAMALIYFGLGEKEKAFNYMEQALEEKSIQIEELMLDPNFSAFRQNPEFETIQEKMNLKTLINKKR
jgi:serine/threonine-protein kinase